MTAPAPDQESASRDLSYERWVAATDWPLIGLSLVFLVVLLVPLAFQLTPLEQNVCLVANIVIWAAFAVDYAVRLYRVSERWRFIRSHPIDLIIVVVPFLRPLRLLRLISLVAVMIRRSRESLASRVTLWVFAIAGLILIAGSVVIFNVERGRPHANITTYPDALWWSFNTLSTVGQGDEHPTTEAGRLVAGVLILCGIALVGTITAAFASWFLGSGERKDRALLEENAFDLRAEWTLMKAEVATLNEHLASLHNEIREMSGKLTALPPPGGAVPLHTGPGRPGDP
jgi:voltage-gated potassium channel